MTKKAGVSAKLEFLGQREKWGSILSTALRSPLFCILLICGIIRVIYYSVLLTTSTPDTATYVNYRSNILKGEVDGFRTPLYPYFIKLIGLFGQPNLLNHVVAAQIILSFFSIIIFYHVVKLLFKVPKVVNGTSLLYGGMLPIINFDKLILTESLAVMFSVVFIYLVVGYLKRPTAGRAWMMTLFVFVAIMLRPSFIFLFPLISTFWIFRIIIIKRESRICISGLAASAVVGLLIAGYSHLNKLSSGFNGISIVSNFNGIAEVKAAGIYPYSNYPKLSAAIDSNVYMLRDSAGNIAGAHILNRFKPDSVHDFIVTCIKNQPLKYFVYICGKLVDNEHQNLFTNYAAHRLNYLAFRINNIEYYVFGVPFNLLFIFIELDIILITIKWIREKQLPWARLFCWLFVTGQVAVAFLGGYSEYQRLILPAIPTLMIALFGYLDTIVFAINKP